MLFIRYKNSVYYIDIECDKYGVYSMEYNIIKMFLRKHNIDIEKIRCKLIPRREKGQFHEYLYFKTEKDANTYVDYINSLIIANSIERI